MPAESFSSDAAAAAAAALGFPGGSDGKESACDAGDTGLIPGQGRCPGEENGYSLQHSCLENSTDRGAWRAIIHGVAESDMTKQLTHSCVCVSLSQAQENQV